MQRKLAVLKLSFYLFLLQFFFIASGCGFYAWITTGSFIGYNPSLFGLGLYVGISGGLSFWLGRLYGESFLPESYTAIHKPIFKIPILFGGYLTIDKPKIYPNDVIVKTILSTGIDGDIVEGEIIKRGPKSSPLKRTEKERFVTEVLEAFEAGDGTLGEIIKRRGKLTYLKANGYKTLESVSERSFRYWREGKHLD